MPTQLGRYTLERKIGAGGMADVWLAQGPQGVCVLKCPHPHLCDNPEFVRMFLDEASILAQLHHGGIAQVFDLGQASGVYFMAMEYVPGFDLMSISLEHERHGELMAPELCARIVADAAAALHYAHEARGKNGEPLNIVHRDVTPHNILLSTQGVVKLIDFGVAKASSTMHQTQAGFVKGKYPYMAPEQITGQSIDRRVDVYALGLVLYELLTNTRAIPGNTEVEQIDAARSGRIRPVEQLRPNVSMPLRQILGGCLHQAVEGRYPTALAVKEDLEKYLALERHVVGQDDLLRLFRVVAADQGEPLPEGRPTEREQPASNGGLIPDDTLPPDKHDLEGYASTLPSMQSTPDPVPPVQNKATPIAAPPPVAVKSDVMESQITEQSQALVSRGPLYALTALSLLVIVLVLGLWQPWKTMGTGEPVVEVVDAGSDIPGKITAFDFKTIDSGVATAVPEPVDAGETAPPVVVAEVDAGHDAVVEPEHPTTPTRPQNPPADVKMATVNITSFAEAEVRVDGKPAGTTPLDLELRPGPHTIVVKAATAEKKFSVKLVAGETKALVLPTPAATVAPVPVEKRKGKLSIHAVPFCNEMTVDGRDALGGKSIGFEAELELLEGNHQVSCTISENNLTKKRSVKVLPDQTVEVQINMLGD